MKLQHSAIALALSFQLYSVSAEETTYPSLPSKVLAHYKTSSAVDRSIQGQVKATEAFLDSLTEEQKKVANLSFEDDAKTDWTNLPQTPPQTGARLGDLNEEQIKKALHLLATITSEAGMKKIIAIPLADDLLLNNGKRKPGFGAEDFWILISGKPSTSTPWAIQFDGHHLAYNIAIKGEQMSMSPSFIGARPSEVTIQGVKTHLLSEQIEQSYQFLDSLTPEQKSKVIISKKRGNIATAAGKDGVIPKPTGVLAKEFNDASKQQLIKLIATYVNDLPEKVAKPRLEAISKELDQTRFSWSGPTKGKGSYSYRIQGPSLIIEFSQQNHANDPEAHLHAMYRDPTNEYGKKMIKK